jgi:hypothetical protein
MQPSLSQTLTPPGNTITKVQPPFHLIVLSGVLSGNAAVKIAKGANEIKKL